MDCRVRGATDGLTERGEQSRRHVAKHVVALTFRRASTRAATRLGPVNPGGWGRGQGHTRVRGGGTLAKIIGSLSNELNRIDIKIRLQFRRSGADCSPLGAPFRRNAIQNSAPSFLFGDEEEQRRRSLPCREQDSVSSPTFE